MCASDYSQNQLKNDEHRKLEAVGVLKLMKVPDAQPSQQELKVKLRWVFLLILAFVLELW